MKQIKMWAHVLRWGINIAHGYLKAFWYIYILRCDSLFSHLICRSFVFANGVWLSYSRRCEFVAEQKRRCLFPFAVIDIIDNGTSNERRNGIDYTYNSNSYVLHIGGIEYLFMRINELMTRSTLHSMVSHTHTYSIFVFFVVEHGGMGGCGLFIYLFIDLFSIIPSLYARMAQRLWWRPNGLSIDGIIGEHTYVV